MDEVFFFLFFFFVQIVYHLFWWLAGPAVSKLTVLTRHVASITLANVLQWDTIT